MIEHEVVDDGCGELAVDGHVELLEYLLVGPVAVRIGNQKGKGNRTRLYIPGDLRGSRDRDRSSHEPCAELQSRGFYHKVYVADSGSST